MSTKIHNGYRLTGDAPAIGSLPRLLNATMRPVLEASLTKQLVGAATIAVDAARDGLETGCSADTPPILWAANEVDEHAKVIEATGRRNPAWDFSFSATFITDPDEPTDTYALIYTERDVFTETWEKFPGVAAYQYWDNADGPDELSGDEWDARRDTWDRLLGGNGLSTPAEAGLSWSLPNVRTMLFRWGPVTLERETIEAAIPSRKDRAQRLAFRRALADIQMDPDRLGMTFQLVSEGAQERFSEALEALRPVTAEDLLLPRG